MDITQNHTRLIAGAACLALIAGAGGLMLGRTMPATDTPATPSAAPPEEDHGPEGFVEMDAARSNAAGIVTQRTVDGAFGAEILAQAMVVATPDGEAALTARADGAITRITKHLGDSVRAGETVALLESRDAATFTADSNSAAARANAARLAYAREKRLFDARVTARQDLEAAQTALAEAEAELQRARSTASAAGAAGGRHLAVTSLISGRITKSDAKLGNYVTAGTELFRVSDPDRIQVEAAIPASDAGRIMRGDRAVIELADGNVVDATVHSTTPSLDQQSRSATVLLDPVAASRLIPGQGARVRITPHKAGSTSGIVLPEEAVQSVGGRDVVFVASPKGFQAVPVTAGQRGGGRIEIVAGLKPGQSVATRGAFLLKAELGKGEAEH